VKVVVSASVEILSEKCFYECASLSDVRFELEARLPRIEEEAFLETRVVEIVISA
jgi:hypothetical protein